MKEKTMEETEGVRAFEGSPPIKPPREGEPMKDHMRKAAEYSAGEQRRKATSSVSVGMEKAVEALNRMLLLDRCAMEEIVRTHFECNEDLVKDPHIQAMPRAGREPSDSQPRYRVRFLGLLNGIYGASEETGYIAAYYGEEGRLLRFGILASAYLAEGK